jgi:outer membrane biosynthesis protein TonB
MAFRAFLQNQPATPPRVLAHLQSGLLHAALLALLFLAGRAPALPDPVSVARPPLTVTVSLVQPAAAPPGLPGAPPATLSTPSPTPRSRPPRRRIEPAIRAAPPATPSAVPTPVVTAQTGMTAAAAGDGQGHSGTDGAAAAGGGGRGRRRAELFARIIGSGIRPGTPVRGDLPFISLREATALRTSDFFPRLPAALWTERSAYLVALEVCVSEQGWVTEASLRSSASARLDPIVLAAARGWRYRPRLLDGRPAPFCHGVLIRYEVTY